MSEVKRYDLLRDYSVDSCECSIDEFSDGYYVRFADYTALQADRDALQSKFDDPRGNICELCESYDSEHDCAECRWNHLDNFHACEPIFDNGGE